MPKPSPFTTWPDVRAARAIELTDHLHSLMVAWNKREPVTSDIRLAADRRSVNLVLLVKEMPPLERYSILVSEIIHHARGALDSLTWEMCSQGGRPLHETSVQFPTLLSAKDWNSIAGNLKPMPDEYLERVRSVQPFHSPEPAVDALGVLARLSNFDKHRGMLEASAGVDSGGVFNVKTGGQKGGVKYEVWEPAVEDQALLARWEFDWPVDIVPRSVHVRLNWRLWEQSEKIHVDIGSFMGLIHGIPEVLDFLRTGRGKLTDAPVEI